MNQSDRILLSNLSPEDIRGSKSLPTPSPSSLADSILPTSQESQSPSIGPNNPNQVSIVIHSNRIQPEQAEVASPIATLRKLKLFPIFGDENIAKLSVNYFLYLEFFHICIKIFCILLVFTGIIFGLMTLGSDVIQRSQDTIMEYYGIFAFLVVIVLKLLLMREEKRLLDHYIMHEFQWTEDLFSLLVQGLPRNADLQEIRDHFNGIIAPEGRVKDVIILQDSHEYAQIKKDIDLIQAKLDKLDRNRKESDKEKRDKENKKLSEELRLKNDLLYKMERELIETRHFKGKAIVVFNTIEAKSIAIKYLKIPIYLKPVLFLCGCCCCCLFDQYRLKGSIISVHEISEPEDVIFPNLYEPKRRFTRTLTAFFSSFTIIFLTLGLLLYLKGIELSEEVGEKTSLVLANSFASYTFTIAVIILGFVLDRGYRYVNGFFTYQSTLKANVNILNYGIFTSFILYILVQAVPASAGYSVWLEQLIRIFLFYFAKLMLLQLFAFCATSNTVKKARTSLTSPLLSKVTTRLHTKYIEFDFIRGITRAVPLLLIPLTFLLLNPIILLGMSIVALYICAIIDKYRMLRRCNIFKMKSSSYMIKAFRVFRWDIPCVAWGSLLVVQSRIIELYPRNLYDYAGRILDSPFFWGTNLCMVGLIVVYIIFTRPLSSKFKEKFFEKNAKVQYDTVCKEFTAHYRDKDPVRQIKRLTYFDKSELVSRKRLLS